MTPLRGALIAFFATLSAAQNLNIAAAVERASTPVRADRPVPASTVPGVDLATMWAQAAAADAPRNTSECQAWLLQYEFSLRLMPERAPLRDVFDALRLDSDCGVSPPAAACTMI